MINNCHRYSPILFRIEPQIVGLTEKEDPAIDYSDIDGVYFLAPRMYLKIYSPRTKNEFIYRVPRSGILSNLVRLTLLPSAKSSTNDSYYVEYWTWEKVIYPKLFSLGEGRKRRPKDIPLDRHTLIKSEYWNVPRIQSNKVKTITLTRTDSDPSFPNTDYILEDKEEVIYIKSVESDRLWMDYTLTEVSYRPFVEGLTKEKVTSYIGIAWGQTYPRPGTEYRVTYVPPINYEGILHTPEQDVRAGAEDQSFKLKPGYYPYISKGIIPFSN